MLEIRVEAPNAVSASALTWHLNEHAEVSEIDGSHWVIIEASHGTLSVFSAIREWLVSEALESVEVRVDGIGQTIFRLRN
jgi:hypothetical protein